MCGSRNLVRHAGSLFNDYQIYPSHLHIATGMTLPAMILLSNDGRQLNEIHATMLETHWLMSHRAWLLVLLVRHFDECSVTLCSFWAQVVVLCRFKEHPLSSECTPPQRDCQIRSALSLNALLNTSYTLILRGNTFAPFSSKCSSAPRYGEKQVREPCCVTLCSFLEWLDALCLHDPL